MPPKFRLAVTSFGATKAQAKIILLLLLLGYGLSCVWESQAVSAVAPRTDFNRDIRPILSENCFACHGPDESQRQAKLRLDTKDGAFAKAGVIVPGNAAASRLVKRITSTDPNLVMPPPDAGHKLTATQIETLKRWVEEGVPWGLHWAFVAPQRPALPPVKNQAWPRNPIDYFVLARLEQEGLQPAPEADRAQLLRRVSFDLTGQCRDTDQPTAALLMDLKERGMLDDTLIVWGGEFGRTVYSQGKLTETNYGRDHHPRAFTIWLAGGGIKPGIMLGETDDFSYNITRDPIHVHDLNATILHCLGIDHKRLTYKYQGRNFRLTDVHGEIVKPLLA